MEQLQLTQSFIQDEQKNQFLDNEFKYENCPHCQRNFFQGKLKYHLKLCKPSNPMIKSPVRRNKKSHFSATVQKSTPQFHEENEKTSLQNLSPQFKYKKCQHCRATFPLSMINRHSQKCNLKPKIKKDPQDLNQFKAKTKVNFQPKKDHKEPSSALPRIRNSAKQTSHKQRTFGSQDFKEGRSSYTVRIREQLSCFKKALEVQQIQCHFCNRKFSKQASLRHIPICEKLKSHESQHISLKKQTKSQVYKLNIPPKKSLLFQSKMMASANQKGLPQIEILSARLPKKINRQKVNNTQFLKQASDKLKSNEIQPEFKNYPIEQKQSVQLFVEDKINTIQTQKMSMTFRKSIENKKLNLKQIIDINPQNQQNLENHSKTPFFEEISSNIVNRFSSQEEENIEEMENQFLKVSESKKSFFGKIDISDLPTNFSVKQNQDLSRKYPSLQKLKLKIDLKDFQQ